MAERQRNGGNKAAGLQSLRLTSWLVLAVT